MRFRSPVRTAALAGVLALGLAGCGDSPAKPVADPFLRVEIGGHAADKPWPTTGFRLAGADGAETEEREQHHGLRPGTGAQPRVGDILVRAEDGEQRRLEGATANRSGAPGGPFI